MCRWYFGSPVLRSPVSMYKVHTASYTTCDAEFRIPTNSLPHLRATHSSRLHTTMGY